MYTPLGGGIDGVSPASQVRPSALWQGVNVEPKNNGGIRSVQGYIKFDDAEISGEGPLLGVHYYNDKVYAVRNAEGGTSATMWESEGGGWTAIKELLSPDGRYS